MAKKIPQINDWYQDVQDDALFEVVAVDEDGGFIEIQYVNGEIGEFDFDTWEQMIILNAQAPEDWRAPFEITDDDNSANSGAFTVSNWDDPQANIDNDTGQGADEY